MARTARRTLAVICLMLATCASSGLATGLSGGGFPCGCPHGGVNRIAAADKPARRPGRVHVLVDLERRELVLYLDYAPVRRYPVAIGKPSTPTPVGDWHIVEKAQWGEGFGSRWMQISVPWGTYGLHGTNRPWTIGDAVSGGCIRMFNEDANEVYEYVRVGTPVKVIGEPLSPLEERETIEPGYLSSRVLLIQRALAEAGYYSGPLDGAWGERSMAAARAFQRTKGLPATGSFDRLSYDALGLLRFE